MRNIISTLLLSMMLLTSFYSCKNEEDDIFDKSSAQRLEAVKKEYSSLLASSKNGWVMEYYYAADKVGYVMLVNFNTDGEAVVAANDALTNNVYQEAGGALWEVIADNGPVLTFNTYNDLLHRFSTPEDIPGTDKDEQGTGYEGDYEFIIVDAPQNATTIMLKGKKRGTYIRMTRMSEDIQWKDYFLQLKALNTLLFTGAPNPMKLKAGNDLYTVYDGGTGIFNIVIPNGDPITDVDNYPFLVLPDGIRFYKEFECANGDKVQEFKMAEDNSKLVSVENPNIWIEGPDPIAVFNEQIMLLKKYVVVDGEMDASTQAIYNRIKEACASKKVPLRQIYFTYSSQYECPRVIIQVSSTTASFLYKKEVTGNKMTLVYDKFDPSSANASVFYQNYDGVSDLINALSASFTLSANKCGLNYQTLKMTSDNGLSLGLKLTN